MSNAPPKTVEHKAERYFAQTGGHLLTIRQKRQLRRTQRHLMAHTARQLRREEEQKRQKRSEAARKGAATRKRNRQVAEILALADKESK